MPQDDKIKTKENVSLKDIRHIFCDVDGVLTDATKTYNAAGSLVSKSFSDLDSMGFSLARRLTIRFAANPSRNIVVPRINLVSGDNRVNEEFARVMGLPFYYTRTDSKIDICMQVLEREYKDITNSEVIFIGNDINDLECLRSFVSFCPSDALPYIQKVCDVVTEAAGGRGVFREIIDSVLFEKGVTLDDYLCCLTPYRNYPDKTIHEIREHLDAKRNGSCETVSREVQYTPGNLFCESRQKTSSD